MTDWDKFNSFTPRDLLVLLALFGLTVFLMGCTKNEDMSYPGYITLQTNNGFGVNATNVDIYLLCEHKGEADRLYLEYNGQTFQEGELLGKLFNPAVENVMIDAWKDELTLPEHIVWTVMAPAELRDDIKLFGVYGNVTIPMNVHITY